MVTKSQKFSLGLLGVAVAAFSVDRWVLSPSSTASGAAISEYAVSPATRSQTSSPTRTSPLNASPTSSTTLANRLSVLAVNRRYQYVATSDAFRACDDWLAQAAPATTGLQTGSAGPAAAAPASDAASTFSSVHSLSAVMTHPAGGGMAIINGKLYEPGQVIDGFKLVKVGAKDATFTGKGATVTLRLPGLTPLTTTR